MEEEKNIKIRLKRSPIGYPNDQKKTLRALGLRKIGDVKTLPRNKQVLGMVRKVVHLIEKV